MKRRIVRLVVIALCGLWIGPAEAQWVPMTPHYTSNVWSLAANGTAVFAGMDNGVFVSADSGSSWKASGLTTSKIYALFVTGGKIFAGTDSGAFRSTDNGANWASVGMNNVAVDAFCADGTRLFAGTGGQGVFISSDGGLTWSASSLGNCTVNSLSFVGSAIIATVALGGVFVSSDSGNTWTAENNGLTTTNVGPLSVYGTDTYVGSDVGVFHSTNDGLLWTNVDPNWNEGTVTSLAVGAGTVVAGTSTDGIFFSTDGGANWNPSSPTGSAIHFLANLNSSLYAGTVSSGVFKSTDHGETWAAMGLTSAGVSSLAAGGGNLFEGTSGGGVFRSTDDGTTWYAANSGLNNPSISSLATEGSVVYAGTFGNEGGVFRSTDYGKSWKITGLRRVPISAIALTSQAVWASSPTGLYVSRNDGTIWNRVLSVGVDPIAALDSEIVAGSGREVLVSTNNGIDWHTSALTGYDMSVAAIAMMGTDIFVAAPPAYPAEGLWLSADSGQTWTQVVSDSGIYSVAVNGNDLYLAEFYGVYAMWDLGARLADVSTGLLNPNPGQQEPVSCLSVGDGYLFAGAPDGRVWRRPLSEITGIRGETASLPAQFSLLQNYPNPFNPSTTIGYELSAAGHVTLMVYDILGRRVATLVDGYKHAGRYEVTFDGSKLASGIYFVRMTSGSYARTRKVVLVK